MDRVLQDGTKLYSRLVIFCYLDYLLPPNVGKHLYLMTSNENVKYRCFDVKNITNRLYTLVK